MTASKATVSRLLESALAGAALFTLIGAGSAGAQVAVLRIPDDSPGIPAYARTDRPFPFHTDQLAAIVFYRAPACVPDSFNLLDLVDPPILNPDGTVKDPRAFGCPLTVSGFELWDNGPGIDAGPRQAVSRGSAVPVWFVSWPDLQRAIADDVLTISELESLNPLKGIARTFHEDIHPLVPPGTTGGAKVVAHLAITASGVLADGRSFQYEFTNVVSPQQQPLHVKIVLR